MELQETKCAGCGHGIIGPQTFAARQWWHPLCWQKKCNDFYFEQTLDDMPSELQEEAELLQNWDEN